MRDNIRILNNDHSGHPFQVQLSRELARRGHEVLHTYSKSFQTPKGPLQRRSNDPENFDVQGIELSESFRKYSFLKRRFQEREYGFLLSKVIMSFKPDLIISSNTPLDAQSIILQTSKQSNIKFIFWVQDIYSIAIQKILAQKLSYLGFFVSSYYRWLERRQLQESDAIILITEDFIPLMKKWKIESAKCWVIPNWAPLNELPLQPKKNKWSINNDVHEKICIMYSGTLGRKHNPEILLRIAQHFSSNENVKITVISEGLGADWLRAKKNELGLKNLALLKYQPFDVLPDVLSSADIFVVILEPEAGVFSVPSKVWTYMCFKRALLLAVPLENLSARIVQQHNAGKVVHPEDIEGVIKEIDILVKNPLLRESLGHNAFSYAQRNFDIQKISDSFEEIIFRVVRLPKSQFDQTNIMIRHLM